MPKINTDGVTSVTSNNQGSATSKDGVAAVLVFTNHTAKATPKGDHK